MPKITYIISDINKALAFEWVAVGLRNRGFDINYVLLNSGDSELEQFLIQEKIPVKRITYRGKNDFFSAFLKLVFHLRLSKPEVIHCHMRDAELIGIPAALFSGIKNRVYTRHSSTYNHLYYPNGVRVDKLVNKLASKIIAISGNVYHVLSEMEHVPTSKITLIPHGFNFEMWQDIPQSEVDTVFETHAIPKDKTIIGVIARYTWWKGYAYSIPAFGRLYKKNPNLHFVFANASGNDQLAIKSLLAKHLPADAYTQISFESNLAALYKVFDLYVHVPYDKSVEAFGQTYVEAMIAGIPSVFTLSGIAPDFVKHEQNALVVRFQNIDEIVNACTRLLQDEELKNSLILEGKKSIESFRYSIFLDRLSSLYLSLTE